MSDSAHEDASKSPDQLEREASEQRSDIQHTLEELAQRFMPRELADQLLSYTRGSGGDLARSVMNAVRSNPLPALVTAGGFVWMMLGQKRSQSRSEGDFLPEDDVPASASYGLDPDYDPRLRDRAASEGRPAGGGLERLLREQPIAIGVIGLALGALAGASFPRSRQEDELLGPAKEKMREKGSQLAGQARAKADDVGRHISDKAKQSSARSSKKTH